MLQQHLSGIIRIPFRVSLTQDDQLRYLMRGEHDKSITATSKVRLRRVDISKVVGDKKTIRRVQSYFELCSIYASEN